MSEKTTMLVPMSCEFKDAIGKYATEHNTDSTKIVRHAVAILIGYDLEKDKVQLGRKRIYANDAERIQAGKDAAKNKRALEKKLVELYDHNEHVRTVLALRDSLIAKGINPDE